MNVTDQKTSLLAIAVVFATVGGAVLPTKIIEGSVLLLIAVALLVARGYLEKAGIVAGKY